MSLDTYNQLIGIGAISLQVLALAFLAAYVLRTKYPDLRGIGDFLAERGLWLGFVLALFAAIFSLVHSHVFGIVPCDLCWWQRIFIYSQAVILGVAASRKETVIAIYSMSLSVVGAGFAIYHHALQMLPMGSIPCPATGPSCAQILFLEFGYITYPMLALSIFALLFVLMLFVRERAS